MPRLPFAPIRPASLGWAQASGCLFSSPGDSDVTVVPAQQLTAPGNWPDVQNLRLHPRPIASESAILARTWGSGSTAESENSALEQEFPEGRAWSSAATGRAGGWCTVAGHRTWPGLLAHSEALKLPSGGT